MKTGHTEESGYGLVGSAVRDGQRVVMVLNGMDSVKQRSTESRRLMDLIFREYQSYEFFKKGQPVDQANVWLGTAPQVDLVLDAPLKETLAAAMLHLSEWSQYYKEGKPFYDPMCGSGTILIEAAYIAMNKAPLIHRKKGEFSLEALRDFDYQLWRQTQDQVRQQKYAAPEQGIFGSDINRKFVEITKSHALRARVERHITVESADFLKRKAPCSPGILVCNLPYGERLEGQGSETIKEFYQEIGNTLKRNYSGWKVALLAAEDAPFKFIGLRPSRKIPLLNGSIKCKLLIFEMYQGSKKTKN